jgi:hypothetical protein
MTHGQEITILITVILESGAICNLIAYKKRFNQWIWFFAGTIGLIGLIIGLSLPSAKESSLDENQRNKRRRIGNIGGLVIICIGILGWVIFIINH